MPARASSQRLAPMIEGYLADYPPTDRLGLRFDDLRIDVATNSRPLADSLRGYFRDFLFQRGDTEPATVTVEAIEAPPQTPPLEFAAKEPEPGKARVKEEFHDFPDGRAVRKRLTGMLFLFGAGHHLAIGPCLDNPNQIVNFVNNRFIETLLSRGCLLGHAAGVALPPASGLGRGVAVAGFAGMGKSTLALHLMRRDLHFISNDRLLVERTQDGPVMYGLAKMPRINPGTVLANPALSGVITQEQRDAFLRLPEDDLWALEHKFDAFIDDCFGPGRFDLKARMSGLAILNWRRGGGPLKARQVDLAARRDLLPAFMKSAGLFVAPAGLSNLDEDAYIEALAGSTVLELSGGVDFEGAAEVCLDLLQDRQ